MGRIFIKSTVGFELRRLTMRKAFCLILIVVIISLTSPEVLSSQILSPADIMERYGRAVVLIATIKNN